MELFIERSCQPGINALEVTLLNDVKMTSNRRVVKSSYTNYVQKNPNDLKAPERDS